MSKTIKDNGKKRGNVVLESSDDQHVKPMKSNINRTYQQERSKSNGRRRDAPISDSEDNYKKPQS